MRKNQITKTQRHMRGAYCEHTTAPKSLFDPRSFRYIQSGKSWLLIGCPKGKWAARKAHCKVSTLSHKHFIPAKSGRCPIGGKVIRK